MNNLKNLRVINVNTKDNILEFTNNVKLYSTHEQDCCEQHYLSLENLTLSDFDGLIFNLSNDKFFTKIPDYGIALKPVNGFPVRIPGYGWNNGYYSTELTLVIENKNGYNKHWNISDCQVIDC